MILLRCWNVKLGSIINGDWLQDSMGLSDTQVGVKWKLHPSEECISHLVIFDPRWNKMWLHLQCKYWSVPIPLSVPEDKDSGLSIIIILPLALKQHVWIGNCLSLSLSLSLPVDDLETVRPLGLSWKYLLSFFQWSFKSLLMKVHVSLKRKVIEDEGCKEPLSGLIFWWKVTEEIRKPTLRKCFWLSAPFSETEKKGINLHLVSFYLLLFSPNLPTL